MQTYLEQVVQVVKQGMEDKIFPGAVIHLVRNGKLVLFESFGYAELTPNLRYMNKDTLFDLASLTKVVATLPAILRSVQLGKLDLANPIQYYFPQWNNQTGGYPRSEVTAVELLTHTSGLPAWRPFYLTEKSRGQYLHAICREPLEYPTGTKVVYSDLGFMLLGFLLEEIWQKPLAEVCDELVFQPLGMGNTGYLPDVSRDSIAATEKGNPYELGMCQNFVQHLADEEVAVGFRATEQDIRRCPWRTETICGEVHDGNAFYGLQGISGHAGLFSNAADLGRYLDMWRAEGTVDGKPFLDKKWVRLATVNHAPELNIARGYGFEVAPKAESEQWNAGCSAGSAASEGAFGHTGFTGTSLWHDPGTDTQIIVLTNRVHPKVHDGIKEWRHLLHTAAFSSR